MQDMNSSNSASNLLPADIPLPKVQLQKLSQQHKDVMSLIAKGVGRQEVASIVGFTPEYVTWLCRQAVCQEYLQGIIAVVDFRLQAMTQDSVEAIHDVLKNGAPDARMKAAKLQLEAVGKIGAGKNAAQLHPTAPDHLQQLADRLVNLLKSSQPSTGATTYESEIHEVEDAEVLVPIRSEGNQTAGPQAAGNQPFAGTV